MRAKHFNMFSTPRQEHFTIDPILRGLFLHPSPSVLGANLAKSSCISIVCSGLKVIQLQIPPPTLTYSPNTSYFNLLPNTSYSNLLPQHLLLYLLQPTPQLYLLQPTPQHLLLYLLQPTPQPLLLYLLQPTSQYLLLQPTPQHPLLHLNLHLLHLNLHLLPNTPYFP